MSEASRAALAERIDKIEEAYEFMLSYAARGRERDDDSDPAAGVRRFLQNAIAALDGLAEAADARARAIGLSATVWQPYSKILAADATRARAAFALVLARPAIGSAMIDNLNASIHVRTVVSDLFLIDSALEAKAER